MSRSSRQQQGEVSILRQADQICRERGVRLTLQRRRVLEILSAWPQPMGAYEILERLAGTIPGARPATVYRALQFLQSQGLVHRLESLNAYVGCVHPEHPHASQFLICRDCGQVEELADASVEQILGRAARALGFRADSKIIEVTGCCARCAGTDDSSRVG